MKQLEPTGLERLLGRAMMPRMWAWLWLSVVLVIAVWWVAQHMLTVLLWKVVILTVCGFLGDKIARGMENSNERPHSLLSHAKELRLPHVVFVDGPPIMPSDRELDAAESLERRADAIYLRRALIISACVIAGALGT
jgi:hypothetical protein